MRIGICDCETHKIVHIYEADAPTPEKFGGPWKEEAKCAHVLVSEDVPLDAPLESLSMADVQIQVGTKMVPDGEPRQAKDDEGEPMVDENDEPIMVQDHKSVPVMETQKRIVQS